MRLTANRHYVHGSDDKQRAVQVQGDDVIYGTDPELNYENKLGVLKQGEVLVIAAGTYFSSLGDSGLTERDDAVDPRVAELKPDVVAEDPKPKRAKRSKS